MPIEQDLEKILREYTQEVGELTNDVMKDASRGTVQELKNTSPKLSGDYAKDWAVKVERGAGGSAVFIVHNRKHYMLTHLLENGHALVRGGRTVGEVNPFPHIEPAQQEAERYMLDHLQEALEK